MQKKGRTAKSAIILTIISIISKPIGLLKEIIVAAFLGASVYKDAFLIAFTIPNIIAAFISEGLNQVFVPLFTEKINGGEAPEAWKVASIISNLLLLIASVLTLAVIFLAPWLVGLMAPLVSPLTKYYAVQMTRILAVIIVALIASSLLASILNAYKRFIAPAITFSVMNILIIIITLIFYSKLGVFALVLGTLFGVFATVLVQIPSLLKERVEYSFSLQLGHPEVLTFGKHMLPLVFATFIFGLVSIIERIFASGYPAGSISALDYSFRIINLLHSMLIATLITAAFPTISLYALDATRARFGEAVSQLIRSVEFLIIPTAVFFLFFSHQIVRLIYERGAFTDAATNLTASILSISLVGFSLSGITWVLFYAFFSLKDTSARMKFALILLVSYVISCVFLVRFFGLLGLPLAGVMAWIIGTVFLVKWFSRAVPGFDFLKLLIRLALVYLAALISVVPAKIAWVYFSARYVTFLAGLLIAPAVFGGYVVLFLFVYLFIIRDREIVKMLQEGAAHFLPNLSKSQSNL